MSVEGGVIKVFEGDFGWTTDFSDIEFYITKNGTKLKFDPASSFDSDREYLQLVNQDIGEEIRVNIYDWGYSSDDGFWEIGKTYRIRFYFVEAGLETEAQVETAEVPYDCSKLGHDWNGGEYEKEPNCKENGIIKYTCNVCGETITEEVPSEPSLHKLITHEAVEATCGKDGNSLYSECELCGKTFAGRTSRVELAKDRWVIPATGNHSWDAGKVTKSPTYTSTGTKKYTCTACGKTKTETIAKLAKVANPLSIKAVKKTVKASKLKKKAVTVSGAIVFTKKGEGKVTYSGTGTNAKSKKALKINASTGKITVKKGTKKGSYKMKVKVKAAGTAKYKAGTKTATVTITVN